MSNQLPDWDPPTHGSTGWDATLDPFLADVVTQHNATDAALDGKVDDAELADAIEAATDAIRQLPPIGSEGQLLAVVGGAPAYVDPASGGGEYPPVGGVPYSSMSTGVKASLDKAESALQSVPSSFATDVELANAIAAITAAAIGAQPAGTYATLVGGHIPTGQMPTDPNAYGAAKAVDLDNTFAIAQDASTTADAAIPTTSKGVANGVASLGSDGKLTAGQLPDIAIMDYVGASANQAAMLAKSGQKGDWTTRTDLGTVWIITGADPTILAGWTQLTYPTAPVTTVFGRTGAVVGSPTDVGAAPLVHTHVAADISDSTTVGRNVVKAADAAAARTAIGAGTSSLALGTSSTTAKAGDYQPAAANISDSTSLGRSILTTASLTAARNALGLYDIAAGGSVAGIPVGSTVIEAT